MRSKRDKFVSLAPLAAVLLFVASGSSVVRDLAWAILALVGVALLWETRDYLLARKNGTLGEEPSPAYWPVGSGRYTRLLVKVFVGRPLSRGRRLLMIALGGALAGLGYVELRSSGGVAAWIYLVCGLAAFISAALGGLPAPPEG